MFPYPDPIEQLIKTLYTSLSEKDRRRYAAVEARKLGHGGIQYIADLLGCSRTTIVRGIADLEAMPAQSEYDARIRQPGGGRKPYDEVYPEIDSAFWDVLDDDIAGDPVDASVHWTHLTQQEIADRLAQKHDITVSTTVVQQLLKKHNFRRRKAQKNAP